MGSIYIYINIYLLLAPTPTRSWGITVGASLYDLEVDEVPFPHNRIHNVVVRAEREEDRGISITAARGECHIAPIIFLNFII